MLLKVAETEADLVCDLVPLLTKIQIKYLGVDTKVIVVINKI